MKNSITKIFVFIVSLLPFYVQASSIDYGNQAIRCSSIYYVLTKVTESNPDLGNYFSNVAQYYSAIYGEERKKVGISTSNGQAIKQRDFVLKQLHQQFQSNQSKVIEEANFCLSWTENIRLSSMQNDYQDAYPKKINVELVSKFEKIVTQSFLAWVQEGPVINSDALKNALKSK